MNKFKQRVLFSTFGMRGNFMIAAGTFLLSALLINLWMKKKLRQDIADLQKQDRFLYTGNTRLPQVALTFDDGPHPAYTPQLLTTLEHYGVKATFFCIGKYVAQYPDLVKQTHAAGHVIGNHSWSHPLMAVLPAPLIASQLARTSAMIEQVLGIRPTFFRPPYGLFNAAVLRKAHQLAMKTVIWDVRATDWAKPGVDTIVDRVCSRSENGSIVLLHDGGGDRSQTVAAVARIIEALQERGFQFVTLQEMDQGLHSSPKSIGGPKDQAWSDILKQLI